MEEQEKEKTSRLKKIVTLGGGIKFANKHLYFPDSSGRMPSNLTEVEQAVWQEVHDNGDYDTLSNISNKLEYSGREIRVALLSLLRRGTIQKAPELFEEEVVYEIGRRNR